MSPRGMESTWLCVLEVLAMAPLGANPTRAMSPAATASPIRLKRRFCDILLAPVVRFCSAKCGNSHTK